MRPDHFPPSTLHESEPIGRLPLHQSSAPFAIDSWPAPPRNDDPDDDRDAAPLPPRRRTGFFRWLVRGLAVVVILVVLAIGWLAVTAPLSKSLQPPTPPRVTLLASDGTPIARRGAIVAKPVKVAELPRYVPQAFIAIEDRRFYHHWGIDPRGMARALVHNVTRRRLGEGGSTITQQLAKNAFLDADRTAGRKIREMLIAFWLEAWLSKDEILSRYLSNVYFGDNIFGLRAAARHYFSREPEDLGVGQAAMLAGLVKAPSRLAPTGNLDGAQARQRLVVSAMREAGYLTADQADHVAPATTRTRGTVTLPVGTYFADWVLPAARDTSGDLSAETTVTTTLDRRLQQVAERAVHGAGLKQAQVALVAMRPDGRVVAMVGGRSYEDSPFNRATQARRQPGSTFKLFVYLAALRAGLTPDSTVEDRPVTIAGWSPRNSDGRYRGRISLREAFQRSSNVAAARLTQRVGVPAVIRAARDLGLSTPIPNEASIALGTSTVSLLELTAAFAGIANDGYPVGARGLTDAPQRGWLDTLVHGEHHLGGHVRDEMLDLLSASATAGTGRQAALSVPTYGKTGTTQDNRDALFIGFANGLVCGVWVGNDDNRPNPGLSGGGVPARIWRSFMTRALGVAAKERPRPVADAAVDPDAATNNSMTIDPGLGPLGLDGEIKGLGVRLRLGKDGSIELGRLPGDGRGPLPVPPSRDERRPAPAPAPAPGARDEQ